MLRQHIRSNFRVLLDQTEDGVLGDVGSGGGKVHQCLEARVRLAQHGVTVARDDAAGLECRPEVILDILVAGVIADVLLHLQDPA